MPLSRAMQQLAVPRCGDADHQVAQGAGGLRRDRRLPHLGLRAAEHVAVVVELGVDDVRLHHLAAVGDGGRHHRHVERHHLVVVLAEAADRRAAAGSWSMSDEVADRARHRARQVDRHGPRRRPSAATPSIEALRPELDARCGRTACCSYGRTPSARSPPQTLAAVVLDRVVGLRRQELALVGEEAVEVDARRRRGRCRSSAP